MIVDVICDEKPGKKERVIQDIFLLKVRAKIYCVANTKMCSLEDFFFP